MERVIRRLDSQDLDGARREVDRMVERFGTCAETAYVRGLLRLEEENEEAAFDLLLEAFRSDGTLVDAGLTALELLPDEEDPQLVLDLTARLLRAELSPEERADVAYREALALRALGDEPKTVQRFLEVWSLDHARRRRRGVTRVSLARFGKMLKAAIDQLPDPIRLRIEHVPIVVQDRPDRETVSTGFDPRALGMFDGSPYAESGPPLLTRIVVFQRNLEEVVEDEKQLEEEVYVTLLHETGHFFGLSEEDLDQRGLA